MLNSLSRRSLGLAMLLATLPSLAHSEHEFCTSPSPRPPQFSLAAQGAAPAVNETEPNNSLVQAEFIPLGYDPGQFETLDVTATFGFSGDEDFVRFTGRRGDVLGVTAVSEVPSMPVDTVLTLVDAGGFIQQASDVHAQILTLFPPETGVRTPVTLSDAILLWMVPADGDYVIRVQEAANGTGPYTLRLFLGRPTLETAPPGSKQVIFLDFDGATLDAASIFGIGNPSATLSPLAAFLGNWGLSQADENAVIDAIVAQITADLNSAAALNPRFGYELRNSRDHADMFGADPFVSRVVVGGTATQLGITTNGIAEWFDLGNFSTNDTAVVLLDRLSAPVGGPDSVNSVPRAAGVSVIDAVGVFVGRVISHEIGHYVGHFHTDPTNGTPTIMDRANIPANLVGVGPDGILGSLDDDSITFESDAYDPIPGFLSGVQPVDVQTAFGLSTPARAIDFCTGDGGDGSGCTNCPCGNNAAPGSPGGCLNSANTSANLTVSGDASVSLPPGSTSDLRFALAAAPPTSFCILNSGDALAPGSMSNPCFGLGSGVQAIQFDGLRCAIVNTRRHGGRSADGNGAVGNGTPPWGGEAGPPAGIAQAGAGFAAGQTRYFQAISRDDPLAGCLRGLNTSQAVEVLFGP